MSVLHNIPPVFNHDSRILILGSFPSVLSRDQAFFYAHPRNRFWHVLAAVFSEATPDTVDDKKRFLLRNHIALWDVVRTCDIHASADSSIKKVEPNPVSIILNSAKIESIFVNGKTAEKFYNRLLYPDTGITAVCLPSTSPANARMSEADLIRYWSEALNKKSKKDAV